ncbi:hypothetical protein KZZ07_23510 [Mameliella sp. CS4]|nr:hypothetical protein [Mameliella sp. CS4]MBW4985512.1 hypothetical protein [Mameliella sp. CS4]
MAFAVGGGAFDDLERVAEGRVLFDPLHQGGGDAGAGLDADAAALRPDLPGHREEVVTDPRAHVDECVARLQDLGVVMRQQALAEIVMRALVEDQVLDPVRVVQHGQGSGGAGPR